MAGEQVSSPQWGIRLHLCFFERSSGITRVVEQKALSTHRVLVHLGLVRSPDKIHNDLGDLLLINASRLLPFPKIRVTTASACCCQALKSGDHPIVEIAPRIRPSRPNSHRRGVIAMNVLVLRSSPRTTTSKPGAAYTWDVRSARPEVERGCLVGRGTQLLRSTD
ncbi:uncharacterized protein BO96DRAFT_465561 [Aspergillus niger CBS 101883]|uniref:Uncharacterized protein n=2 Tax=Aspergillus niger TaxID=5061 RepID=A2QAZ2_ASPNC|nr:uncharacterized protein BO96DRAFT_465561 [Aspergillus niger CBS 101883]XP_059605913.1 hypothetical protein An01g13300 [Aspergillus niger]PYH57312.1 hypothetical protein BO96DRAFT_465561 [Aspergillus niger CBS 101883]CAK96200.1 hypothetical protein An01g13300 [Aspergillus niger]